MRKPPCAAMRILAETALPQGSPDAGRSILGILKGFSPPSAVPQPRPMYGIVVAVIVRNWTLASSGSEAM